MHIISESVVIANLPVIIKISPCLSKLQLAKAGTFLLRHGVVACNDLNTECSGHVVYTELFLQ